MTSAITGFILFIFWLVFIVYWAVSAKNVKRDKERGNGMGRYAWAIVVVIAVVLLSQIDFLQKPLLPDNLLISLIALVLSACGIGFAIWARWHLGKNWSPRPAIKENHELITSGPYSFVRHPIYTGVCVAIIGSMLISTRLWVIVLVLLVIMFIYRIKTEEQFMARLFPEIYPEYKKRTKALIPFVW